MAFPVSRRIVSAWCGLFMTGQMAAQAGTTLHLTEALANAEASNAVLQQYPFQQRQHLALMEQATRRPPPTLQVGVQNVAGSGVLEGVDRAEVTLMLGQYIERGGKRAGRLAMATAEQQQAQAEYGLARVAVLAETGRRYYRLLHLQAMDRLFARRIAQEQKALKVLERRAGAGAVSDVDVAKMDLHVAESKAQRRYLQDDLSLARLQLSSMWQEKPTFQKVAGDLSHLPTMPSEADVLAQLEKSPPIFLQQALVQLAEGQLLKEESLGRADVRMGVGVKYLAKDDAAALAFQVGVPLHFSNPNQGRIQAARIAQQQSQLQKNLAFQQLSLQLIEIQQKAALLKHQTDTISQTLLPKAKALLEATESSLSKGQSTVLQWADAEDSVYRLEQSLLDHHWLIYTHLLELERITGLSLMVSPRNDKEKM